MNTNLTTEFGERLVKLSTGADGLRSELLCQVRAVGDDEMEFIATDETKDRYAEVIKIDGWQLDNYRKNPVVVDSHNYWTLGALIGRSEEVVIEKGKMRNRVKFALDNPLGAMSYKMAKAGFIKSESVGFIPIEWKNGSGEMEPRRTYLKQELLEISLVSVPANPGATIEAALKSGAVQRGDVRALFDWLKQFHGEKAAASIEPDARVDAVEGADLLKLARSVAATLRRA